MFCFIIVERITILYNTEKYEDFKIHILLISKASDKTTLEMEKIILRTNKINYYPQFCMEGNSK
jgi:hypothetical protein